MSQRLGIAAALLGDPAVLMFGLMGTAVGSLVRHTVDAVTIVVAICSYCLVS